MNQIIKEIQNYAAITTGRQKEYYIGLLEVAKPVKVASINEVFSEDEITMINVLVKPEERHCYRNAGKLAHLFPDKITYVEGKVMTDLGVVIDHAFNKIGDQYIDITYEMALGLDVESLGYVSIGEYSDEEVIDAGIARGYWGGVYNYFWKQKIELVKI